MYTTPGPGVIAKITLANMNAANVGEETIVPIMIEHYLNVGRSLEFLKAAAVPGLAIDWDLVPTPV